MGKMQAPSFIFMANASVDMALVKSQSRPC